MTLYRNVITVEILSNEPWDEGALGNFDLVNAETRDGMSSGKITVTTHNEPVSRERMAELLVAQGSDPSFLLGDDDADDEDDLP